jgi:hypothetical protein
MGVVEMLVVNKHGDSMPSRLNEVTVVLRITQSNSHERHKEIMPWLPELGNLSHLIEKMYCLQGDRA